MINFFKIFFTYILFFNYLFAYEQLAKIELISNFNCKISSFSIDNEIFLGVGSTFDDSTLKNEACSIKYDIKNKKLIQEKSFIDIDSFYKIISYNNQYFLLGARFLPLEQNTAKSYVDRGFIGVLLKLNSDEIIEKKVDINLNGFGNVRDFQIDNDEIVVLTAIKNSTENDEKIYTTISIENFDTNLSFTKNLQLKTKDYLANNFYIDKNSYVITDDYNQKICLFDKNGYLEKCLDQNKDNEIIKIENQKKSLTKQYGITAYDSIFEYAIKQEMNYDNKLDKYINSLYLYKIGIK